MSPGVSLQSHSPGRRIQTPIVLQMEAQSCGLAALAMVLAYYGRPASWAELRARAQRPEGNGMTAAHLLRIARDYGVIARGFRQPAKSLLASPPPLPFVALWEANHFVVVEGVGSGIVYLNDPAAGRKVVSEADFEEAFSEVFLTFAPGPAGQETRPQQAEDPLASRLQAGVVGEVLTLPAQVATYSQDFGRLVTKQPPVVVKTTGEADVVHCLQVARAAGLPVTVRGTAHSVMGQTLSDQGVVMVNAADHVEFRLLEDQRVEVSGRSQWAYLERELNRLGRSAPVLTGNLKTTVGGTLSVGGYGQRSVTYGAQVHQVERVRLAQPDGMAVWCAPDENPQLFRYSLAGLGQVGVMERVVMRTIPFPRPLRHLVYQQPTATTWLDSFAWLEGEPGEWLESFLAYYVHGRGYYTLYGVAGEEGVASGKWQVASQDCHLPPATCYLPPPAPPPLVRQESARVASAPPFSQPLRTDCYNLPADYVLDLAGLRPFVHFLADQWENGPLGRYVDGFAIHAIRRPAGAITFPLEASATFTAPMTYLIGFYPEIGGEDLEGVAAVQAVLRLALAKCLTLGGRPYLYGWHEMDEQVRRQVYGRAYEELKQLRRQLDPHNLFNTGVFS
ncbi:MAG: cysteine peptidase family C39 domain-containing protein [Chloroflexota bacterium]